VEKRIIELEKKAAFQEHTIEELHEVLLMQQKKINELEKYLNQMKEQMTSGDLVKKQEDETPPPHY